MKRTHRYGFFKNRIDFRTIWDSMLAKSKMNCVKNASPLQKTFVVVFSLLVFSSSSIEYTDKRIYIPIFMERSELEKSVTFINEGRDLVNPGKIYAYGRYILINERYKGVHVIDNTTPETPQNIAFITAPGCLDMAVKDGILFVDNAVDLVAFNLKSHLVANRIRNILPPPPSPDNTHYYNPKGASKGLILVEWKKKTKSDES